MLWCENTGDNQGQQGNQRRPEVVASMKLGLLGYPRTCLKGPLIAVIGSGAREEWIGCGTAE